MLSKIKILQGQISQDVKQRQAINEANRDEWQQKFAVERTETSPRLRPDEKFKLRNQQRVLNAINVLQKQRAAMEDRMDQRLEQIAKDKWKVKDPVKRTRNKNQVVDTKKDDGPKYNSEFVHQFLQRRANQHSQKSFASSKAEVQNVRSPSKVFLH